MTDSPDGAGGPDSDEVPTRPPDTNDLGMPKSSMDDRDPAVTDLASRRQVLSAIGATGFVTLAGCTGIEDDESPAPGQIGSGRSPFGDRNLQGGVPMAEMPALSGELTVYSGRGEALVGELIEYIEDLYDDLTLRVRYAGSTELLNQILTEGDSSSADVFYSVNAGSLGVLADEGRTTDLPGEVLDLVPAEFRANSGTWTGTSGRARTIPYNTDQFDEADIPADIYAFPEDTRFEDAMGWAPAYGSFQAFVTAMRILDGDQRTREWLQGMMDAGVRRYSDEFLVAQAVADGEIEAGFANHYYTLRVQARREAAPIDIAFTRNDPGAVFNVAGAAVVDTAADETLASEFVRHLLSAEAQDYFARSTFEYPLVPEVDPVGDIPPIDELDPPEDLDLSELSDLESTVELMRDVGIDV